MRANLTAQSGKNGHPLNCYQPRSFKIKNGHVLDTVLYVDRQYIASITEEVSYMCRKLHMIPHCDKPLLNKKHADIPLRHVSVSVIDFGDDCRPGNSSSALRVFRQETRVIQKLKSAGVSNDTRLLIHKHFTNLGESLPSSNDAEEIRDKGTGI